MIEFNAGCLHVFEAVSRWEDFFRRSNNWLNWGQRERQRKLLMFISVEGIMKAAGVEEIIMVKEELRREG
jgi:hypothetical protein